MSTGIYLLKFNNTSKVYIGQSTNLELRITQHIALFRATKASQKMQEAFNTYGLPKMEVLIECEAHELDSLEYEAISLYDSVNNGFNTRKSIGGGSNLWGELNGRSKYSNNQIIDAFFLLLQSPKLTYQKIFNKTGVPKPTLVDISNGTGHKWLGSMFSKEYALLLSYIHKRNTRFYHRVLSPTGEIYTVEHLSNFCKTHRLDTGNMSRVLTGKKKQYLGWRIIA